jgi:hypothetical protein
MPLVYLTSFAFWGKELRQSVAFAGTRMAHESPPPTENFEETPVVYWEAYDFTEESGLDLEDARTKNKVTV